MQGNSTGSLVVCWRHWAESAPQWQCSAPWMRNDAVEHVLLHPTSPSLQSGACRWANGELTPLTRRVPTLFSHSSLSSLSQQLLQSETLRHHIDITLALRTYLLTSQGRRRCLSEMAFAYEWSVSNQNKTPNVLHAQQPPLNRIRASHNFSIWQSMQKISNFKIKKIH